MNEAKDRDVMGYLGELSRDQRRKLREKLKADLIKLEGLSSKLEARALQLSESRPAPPRSSFSYGHFFEDQVSAKNSSGHKEVSSQLNSVRSGPQLTKQPSFAAINNARNGGCRKEASPQLNSGRVDPQLTKQPSFAASNNASSPLRAEPQAPKQASKPSQVYDKSKSLVGKGKPPSSVKSNTKLAKSNGQGGRMVKGEQPKQKSSRTSNEVKSHCRNMLKKLMSNEDGWIFNEPVDAVKLGLSDYHAVIKKPMDLGTIKAKLEKKRYASPFEFADDIRLTFTNAMTYNPPGNDVHQSAKILLAMFQKDWDVLQERLERIEGGGEVVQSKSAGHLPVVAQVKSNGKVPLPNQSALPSRKPVQAKAGSVPAKKSRHSTGPPKGRLATPKTFLKDETQGTPKVWPRPEAPIKPKATAKSETILKPKFSGKPKSSTKAKAEAGVKPKIPLKTDKLAKSTVPKKVMSYEEKVRLQTLLGQLPQRVLEELILVIKVRDDIDMNQDGDEIELDLDSFDDEILWELDRRANEYLNNHAKKAESSKRPMQEEHTERNGKKQKAAVSGVFVPDLEKHVDSGNKSSSDSGSSSDSDSRSFSTSNSDE